MVVVPGNHDSRNVGLPPLRGTHRRPRVRTLDDGRRGHRRARLERAGPGLRAGRPGALRLAARAVRPARRLPHLHAAPPPAADPRHGARAQHGLRRRRPARGAAGVRREPRALRPQARAVRVAARAPLRRQRRAPALRCACGATPKRATTSSGSRTTGCRWRASIRSMGRRRSSTSCRPRRRSTSTSAPCPRRRADRRSPAAGRRARRRRTLPARGRRGGREARRRRTPWRPASSPAGGRSCAATPARR